MRNPIILLIALAVTVYAMTMEWATAMEGGLEARKMVKYNGTDLLHNDMNWMPISFYGLAILAVVIATFISKNKKTIRRVYQSLFFLNFLPIGAMMFVMIIDYHMDHYFLDIGMGYPLWIVTNVLMMTWLYLVLYTKIALPIEPTHPDLIDDLPSFISDKPNLEK